jgi:DNA-binding NarL/FixJ family response regulator
MTEAHVLLVEDEFLTALELASTVEAAGYAVVGPAGRLEQALALAEGSDLDAALLDLNLRGDSSVPVAAVLKRRGIPFAFASGYDRSTLNGEFTDAPFLTKPYLKDTVLEVLGRLTRQ